jgi:hypothetical protein
MADSIKERFVAAVKDRDFRDVVGIIQRYDARAFINTRDSAGRTVLHLAVLFRSLANRGDLIEFLLKNGADVDARIDNDRKETALQIAAHDGDYAIIDLLINWGADVNAPPICENGRTALEAAVSGQSLFVTAQLINRGARISPSRVAWHLIDDEMARLLLENGADVMHNDTADTDMIRSHRDKLLEPGVQRRLIVCCDGTWQENNTSQPLSNVARIALCFSDYTPPGTGQALTQIVHYQSGVGTSPFVFDNWYEAMQARGIVNFNFSFRLVSYTYH